VNVDAQNIVNELVLTQIDVYRGNREQERLETARAPAWSPAKKALEVKRSCSLTSAGSA
jgi:hypothetical protein